MAHTWTSEQLVDAAAAIVDRTRASTPLVVQLTNIVSANEQANWTLAVGGSPIMSLAEEEQDTLAQLTSSLLINIGTIHAAQRATIARAVAAANAHAKPVIFDPVGVGATAYRQEVAAEVLGSKLAVVTGNAGEIAYLAGADDSLSRGVDSGRIDPATAASVVRSLATQLGAVVVLHGEVDYISDGEAVAALSNGSARLGELTGTGCGLGSVLGAYVGAVGGRDKRDVFAAAVGAVLAVSVAGELAAEHAGPGRGSYRVALLDALGDVVGDDLRSRARVRLLV
ncbi:Hydroxyethylthiazole kinase [Vanrija pseudolonga]|uniref:hydroxyethylthiazole kinase n=1 Tax=Vanrija pseudolonga TaxID=143232 RepID=A0AAF0Y450_9TREE|nr:Hydroxyethylthiazole kinase [Vanrija pseudolonga]